MIPQMLSWNILRRKVPSYKVEIYTWNFYSYITSVLVLKIKQISAFDKSLKAKKEA